MRKRRVSVGFVVFQCFCFLCFCGFQWFGSFFMGFKGFQWFSLGLQWFGTVLDGFYWFSIGCCSVLGGPLWIFIVFVGFERKTEATIGKPIPADSGTSPDLV